MPHQCTGCGRTFADGSKEMLSGCPDCGGNKFQFKPTSAVDDSGAAAQKAANDVDSEPTDPTPGRSARATASESTTGSLTGSTGTDGRTESAGQATGEPVSQSEDRSNSRTDEDTAQTNARSDVVHPNELPNTSDAGSNEDPDEPSTTTGSTDGPPATTSTSSRTERSESTSNSTSRQGPDSGPDLDDLREKLNNQFESIKIVNPGQYELNLMELYDREEQIISLKEDGRYVIEMPNSLHDEE